MIVIFFMNSGPEDARRDSMEEDCAVGALVVGGYILVFGFGDRFVQLQQQYQTAIPLKMTYLIAAIFSVLGVAAGIGALVFVFGLAWFLLPQSVR